eukprot:Phypoly_transcript_02037.p1 GENE.Phypoly_transcript_02037~~Phypoly_transcript_02037.p1  ORF type:complete len:867 (+),score=123.37 Phypoly_transcript_02037:158-2758(+)
MIQNIPVQYLCSENNYHFSRFTHDLGREVPTLLNTCLAYYAKNVQLLQRHMKFIPAEIIQQIYNHMIGNNLLSPKDLHIFRKSIHQMTIDGSVENGEDFLASYCSVQRNCNLIEDHNTDNDSIPDASDESNSYFNINPNGNNNTCNNNYFYGEHDYHLQVLFGKSIQTSLFDLKEANMVTDLALDDFEDDQVLKKLPANLKHLSMRWCKLSGNESLSFLNDYSHTLQSLRLSSVELKNLTFLSGLTSLTFLDLSINPGIKDTEISCLQKLSKLTTLDLDATGITNDIIPMITKNHPKLVCLNLSGTSVTNQGLEQALVLKDLKVISVMSTHCSSPYPSPENIDVIIIGDYMTKKDARDAAQYSSYFSRAVQLRLIFGYYKLVANSRSRPHWPWFVQNILDMAKSSIRNEKLVEMALLFLWGEVCGEAMPEDLLNVAHKPVIASVTTICDYGGINTISKIMEYYVKNHRANGANVLLFAIGLLTVASHNNKMSQTLMYHSKIVPLVLEAFQTYEKIEPNFQKFVLGVLIQLSANVQCNSQISLPKVVQMCVIDCINAKEYVRHDDCHKVVLALRSTAVLHNLSCWESNTHKLLDYGILDSISEILSMNKQSNTAVLEASSYFEPLAIATLVNLCRKGVCTMYSYNRWKKVLGLAIESFKEMMTHNQLQAAPPTNICYEFCSINDWDLARSVVALFVNCLTVDQRWALLFSKNFLDAEIINLFLQYALIVDIEGQILLGLLFCLIVDIDTLNFPTRQLVLEQISLWAKRLPETFPPKFRAFVWSDITHANALLQSKEKEVREWSRAFLDASAKLSLKSYRVPKRPVESTPDTHEPHQKKRRSEASSRSAPSHPPPPSRTPFPLHPFNQ